MKGILKTFAATALLAALACGGAFALDLNEESFNHDSAYIIEDTTRNILTTLNSRLDAYRKVALPAAVAPASEAAGEFIGAAEAEPAAAAVTTTAESDGALGSLVLPTFINYGSRYANRFWAGGFGTWQKADALRTNTREEYASYKYTGQGALLGYEYAAGAGVFGIAGSAVKGKYEDGYADRHNSEIRQYSAQFYGTYNNSRGFFFTLAGGYTYGSVDIDESNSNIRSLYSRLEDYHTHTVNGGFTVGFDFEPTETLVITPSIGGNFFHTRGNSHNIHLDGLTHRQSELRHNQFEIPLDVQVSKEISFGVNRSLQLSANGGYSYNFNENPFSGEATEASGGRVKVVGRELGRSAWKAGVGARLKMDQWDIGVKYDFLKRSDFDAHRLMGTVGFSF